MNRILLIWNIVLSVVVVALLVVTLSFGVSMQSQIDDNKTAIEELPETIENKVDSYFNTQAESLMEEIMNILKLIDLTQFIPQ